MTIAAPGVPTRTRPARPRLRLARALAEPPPSLAAAPDAPVLLFMPAHDEEEAIGACLARVPATAGGRQLDVVVVDDGSTDDTAARAARRRGRGRVAGREPRPRRRRPHRARPGRVRGAAAVVFCDADGEYPPEEIEALVGPILAGEADYVVGSRFLGRIDHMRPHRRAGNVFLTQALSVVARRPISDGQTGYRAFSPAAAVAAEVVHDYNYAQVLTLDLLAKGFRYLEVPISYHFRTTGRSFVTLGRYLRNVVPAVYRELNA